MNTKIIKKIGVAIGAMFLLCSCTPKNDDKDTNKTPTYSGIYYSEITATGGKSLRDQLTALNSRKRINKTYSGLWDAYKQYDLRPDGTVYDYYCDYHYTFDKQGLNYSKVGDSYNREHAIPQSWFSGSTGNSKMESDFLHVYPTDGKANGIRGNIPFGEVDTTKETDLNYTFPSDSKQKTLIGYSKSGSYSGKVVEPADCYKGDFARSYLYFIVAYKDEQITQTNDAKVMFDLTKIDDEKHYGLTDYSLDLLFRWIKADPVSQREMDRNNGSEAFQGNRNPFIDNPAYIDAIWGDGKVETGNDEAEFKVYWGDTNETNTYVPVTDTVTIDLNKNYFFVACLNGTLLLDGYGQTVSSEVSNTSIFTTASNSFHGKNLILKASTNGESNVTMSAVVNSVTYSKTFKVIAQNGGTGTGTGGQDVPDVTGTDYKFTVQSPTEMSDDNSSGAIVTITDSQSALDSNGRGIQFTSSGEFIKISKIVTNKKIGKVTVEANSNKDKVNTLGVKIGSTQFGSSLSIAKTSDSPKATYKFISTAVASDVVTLVFTRTSGSIYITSITLTFVD